MNKLTNHLICVAVPCVAFSGIAHAQADCPGIFSGESCDVLPSLNAQSNYEVCTDCDDGGTQQVCCYGTSGEDEIVLMVDDGDPLAYGVIDYDDMDEAYFCCLPSDLGASVAVKVFIETYGDPDTICLMDSNRDVCTDYTGSLEEVWNAAADIDSGGGADKVGTCPDGGNNDTVDGGSDGDEIYTYANSAPGSDVIDGEGGADQLAGGAGNDIIYGGNNNDVILGGNDSDKIFGEDGTDILRGNDEPDYIDGGLSTDYLYGGISNDHLCGGDGADEINGEGGDGDCLCGGDETTNDDGEDDALDGGTGMADTCDYRVDLDETDTFTNCYTNNNTVTCSCDCNGDGS